VLPEKAAQKTSEVVNEQNLKFIRKTIVL